MHYQEKRFASPGDLYAAFLSAQEDCIGQLLRQLEDLWLRENTIVIFQSDNGHSTEERAHFGGGSSGLNRGVK
ncbi:sulfatase-like hydrolase/transferase [Arenibacter sp. H213]|uniref:Sulfatase-like hydrolase/transferase n=1 Tax=Arenibacter antarcticus TaxID=2040469 RepID=A0ABW5VBV7_9FLAO|nr:sulfatase-like hydrolase/transferase [Arenibacter sp. H213]